MAVPRAQLLVSSQRAEANNQEMARGPTVPSTVLKRHCYAKAACASSFCALCQPQYEAQCQAQAAQVAEAQAQAQAHFAAQEALYQAGYNLDDLDPETAAAAAHAYGPYFDQQVKARHRGPPLAYRLASMCEGACDGLQAGRLAACGCIFFLLICAAMVVAFLLSSK
ncbi:unnamed protein product [Polarella glacialis]|uniref:Uncharacterized protein n=1 Tax=Polarella glacialis TaxID=89957 RepID=A0A813E672_POLGL|nr:unnamed protein product [Polarella glacialis]